MSWHECAITCHVEVYCAGALCAVSWHECAIACHVKAYYVGALCAMAWLSMQLQGCDVACRSMQWQCYGVTWLAEACHTVQWQGGAVAQHCLLCYDLYPAVVVRGLP